MNSIYELLEIPESSSMRDIKKSMSELVSKKNYGEKWILVFSEYEKIKKIGKEAYDSEISQKRFDKLVSISQDFDKFQAIKPDPKEDEYFNDYVRMFNVRDEKLRLEEKKKKLEEEKRLMQNKKTEAKKKRKFKLAKIAITAGLIIGLGVGSTIIVVNYINDRISKESNTCIVYQVPADMNYNKMEDTLKMRDYSRIKSSVERGKLGVLYAGDVFVTRTTEEIAKELQEKGSAKIISLDEALDLLEENGVNPLGQLKKAEEGTSDIEFNDPNLNTKSIV